MEVNEIFTSFQGEGPFIGKRATFLRLSKCNLNCDFCDTESRDEGEIMSIEDVKNALLDEFDKHNTDFLVITGGEPTLQYKELRELLPLLDGKCEIQFETNGTSHENPIEEAYYVISPKTDKENVYKRYLQYGNVFFKFVIENQTDIDFVLELLEKYEKPANEVYLQPEFSKAPQVMDLILSNRLPLNVRVTGQLHKYLKQR